MIPTVLTDVDDEKWHNAMLLFDDHLLGTVRLVSSPSLGTTGDEVLSAMHTIMKQLYMHIILRTYIKQAYNI